MHDGDSMSRIQRTWSGNPLDHLTAKAINAGVNKTEERRREQEIKGDDDPETKGDHVKRTATVSIEDPSLVDEGQQLRAQTEQGEERI